MTLRPTLLSLAVVLTANTALAQGLSISTDTSPELPGYNIYRPADMDALDAPMPVIAWANGGCVRFDRPWTTLLERWASEGFFVVAITQPPGTTEPGAGGRSTAEDQAAAIDWAMKANTSANSPYAGRLDVTRVVAAGNSCGGITSIALAARDPRVRAVFVLSGSSVGPEATLEQATEAMRDVSVPLGFVVGGPEDVARLQANQDYDLLEAGLAAMVVERVSADHETVSTDPDMQADAAGIALHWLNAILFDDHEAVEALTDGTPCTTCAPGVWTVKTKNLPARD